MKFPRSKFGWVLAGLYLLSVIFFWWKALFDSEGWGFESLGYILMPVLPWTFLFGFIPDIFILGVILYAIFVFLNSAILYFVGRGIQGWFEGKKETRI